MNLLKYVFIGSLLIGSANALACPVPADFEIDTYTEQSIAQIR